MLIRTEQRTGYKKIQFCEMRTTSAFHPFLPLDQRHQSATVCLNSDFIRGRLRPAKGVRGFHTKAHGVRAGLEILVINSD